MGVKVAASCLHLTHTLLPHPLPSAPYHSLAASSPSSSSSSSSSYSSPSSSPVFLSDPQRRRRRSNGGGGWDGALTCRVFCRAGQSSFMGAGAGGLYRSKSVGCMPRLNAEKETPLRRAASASLTESFFPEGGDEGEEDFVNRLNELAQRCQQDAAESDPLSSGDCTLPGVERSAGFSEHGDPLGVLVGGMSSSTLFHPTAYPIGGQPTSLAESATPPPWLGVRPEPPDWIEEGRSQIVPASVSVERNAASVDLPLSLRILKRKKRWESEGWIREAGESATCSVKKALSSLVFIIRELQSYALQLRSGDIFGEDSLREIIARVNREVHASFCWLFGHIFSCTPTLMISVMLLLASFTVYSMGNDVAVAATPMVAPGPRQYAAASCILISTDENQHTTTLSSQHDAPSIGSLSVGVNGGDGGGGKVGPSAGAADDGRWGGRFTAVYQSSTCILPDGFSTVPSTGAAEFEEADQSAAVVPAEEEGRVWSGILEEAARMQATTRDEALMDVDTLLEFVSPVVAEVAPDDDYPEYFRTELTYQQAVGQDPSNALLLCNFAQFLYLVAHDHYRAEYYFKRAAEVRPPDAEALGRYANFLWLAKNDLGAAEETFLEAISADPGNSVHAANYAHFLWNTGGEDTCYPLSSPDGDADAA